MKTPLVALAICLWVGAAPAQDSLPPAVQTALAQAGVPAEALGAIVMPLGHRASTWRHRADLPMQPGSSMKLVTAVVAMDRLGITLRGRTELLSTAPLEDGVLRGDLVLRGGADPDLGLPQLWQMLLELRDQGVREITGDLVVDRSLFRPARPDLGVPPFDESPEADYNVIPDALHLAESLLTVELVADAQTLRVRTIPALPEIELSHRMTLVDLPCKDWDKGWAPHQVQEQPREAGGPVLIELRGTFPRQCTIRTDVQLLDRQRLTGILMRTLWAQLGGLGLRSDREGPTPVGARVLASHEARPWGDVMRRMMKVSDNARTRLLYLQLGQRAKDADPAVPTATLAAREVQRWFAEQRIPSKGLVMDNGSGLSRSERISPQQMAAVLQAALRGRNAADLLASLPIAGVDGTLRRRLKDSPATGWARLKTGTLRNVVALAGVVPGPDGRPWILVSMINHDAATAARPALDALVDWVARGGMNPPRGRRAPSQGDRP